jgi:hypothetical protein
LELDDSQRLLMKDDTSTPTWTIPPHSDVGFPVGTYFHVYVGNTGSVTLARGDGVSLVRAGDPTFTDENQTLVAGYYAKVTQIGQDEWIISGGPKILLSQNGYEFRNGLVEQWGKYDGDIAQDANVTVNFPIEFPVGCWSIVVTPYIDVDDSSTDVVLDIVGDPTSTQFTVTSQSPASDTVNGFYWHAKGH